VKTFLLMLFLLVAAGARPESPILKQGNIELMPIEDGDEFEVGVRVPEDAPADHAIVTVQYEQQTPNLGNLWLQKTMVIDLMPGIFVVSDPVPVPLKDIEIRRVDVVLVKKVEAQSFYLEDKEKP
jgi:hypothetical protein